MREGELESERSLEEESGKKPLTSVYSDLFITLPRVSAGYTSVRHTSRTFVLCCPKYEAADYEVTLVRC